MQIKQILRANLVIAAIVGGLLYAYTVYLVTGDAGYYRPRLSGKFGYPVIHGFIIFYALALPKVLQEKEAAMCRLALLAGVFAFMDSHIQNDPLDSGVLQVLRVYFGASHVIYPLYFFLGGFAKRLRRF